MEKQYSVKDALNYQVTKRKGYSVYIHINKTNNKKYSGKNLAGEPLHWAYADIIGGLRK